MCCNMLFLIPTYNDVSKAWNQHLLPCWIGFLPQKILPYFFNYLESPHSVIKGWKVINRCHIGCVAAYGRFLLQNLTCGKIPGLCVTWRRGRRNLQSFALQLHVLGKNVITLITFSMCVTPVAVHCANDFNQITCCRNSACRLWGVRKNVNLPLRGFFFPLFLSPPPPPCQPLALHAWLCTGAQVTLTASSEGGTEVSPRSAQQEQWMMFIFLYSMTQGLWG